MYTLAADADLATRKIRSKASGAVKYTLMFLSLSTHTILLTFGHFPGSENHVFHFHFINNHGTVEVVSMFTRFIATPLLFMIKFIVKSLVYRDRTVIIKMPLIRHVMPKRKLRGFLRQRKVSRARSRAQSADFDRVRVQTDQEPASPVHQARD
mmetsp:Transcript_104276/g.300564  ORF Transcript_104276/g.300564 Transcript_104276/m.300564 type:complete len:153 (-) Transcript_104276:1623-2081(-)